MGKKFDITEAISADYPRLLRKNLPWSCRVVCLIHNNTSKSSRVILRQPGILPKCLIRCDRPMAHLQLMILSHRENVSKLTHTSALPLATVDPCSSSTVYSGCELLIVVNACLESSNQVHELSESANTWKSGPPTDISNEYEDAPPGISSRQQQWNQMRTTPHPQH